MINSADLNDVVPDKHVSMIIAVQIKICAKRIQSAVLWVKFATRPTINVDHLKKVKHIVMDRVALQVKSVSLLMVRNNAVPMVRNMVLKEIM